MKENEGIDWDSDEFHQNKEAFEQAKHFGTAEQTGKSTTRGLKKESREEKDG